MMVHCSSKKIFSEKVVHSCHDATGSTTEQALHRVLSCWTHHEAQMQSVSSQDAIPFFRIPLLWCYMSLTSSNALRIFNETNMPFPKKKKRKGHCPSMPSMYMRGEDSLATLLSPKWQQLHSLTQWSSWAYTLPVQARQSTESNSVPTKPDSLFLEYHLV